MASGPIRGPTRASFFGADGESVDNVIVLDDYRGRRLIRKTRLLHFSNSGPSASAVRIFNSCDVEALPICSEDQLFERLEIGQPDIILIESDLAWAEPVELIDRLNNLLGVPVVMVCTRQSRKSDRPSLFKRAFAAGLQDVLFAPFRREELQETLAVLMKYRRKIFG